MGDGAGADSAEWAHANGTLMHGMPPRSRSNDLSKGTLRLPLLTQSFWPLGSDVQGDHQKVSRAAKLRDGSSVRALDIRDVRDKITQYMSKWQSN